MTPEDDITALRAALEAAYPREEIDLDAVARLVERLEAAEANAARYRWLRAGDYSIKLARSILNDTPHGIDAAVDAAMRAKP